MCFELVQIIPHASDVAIGNQFSYMWDLSYGVSQGAVAFFMLFNLYVEPLGQMSHSLGVCCHQYVDYINISIEFD